MCAADAEMRPHERDVPTVVDTDEIMIVMIGNDKRKSSEERCTRSRLMSLTNGVCKSYKESNGTTMYME